MADSNDLFAPPTDEELKMFAAPSPEEIQAARPSIASKVSTALAQKVAPITNSITDADSNGTLSSLGQSALDAAKGLGNGLTFGTADEIGGGLSALAEAAYNKLNPTSRALAAQGFNEQTPDLKDLYRKNQQDIQKNFDESDKNSPWLYTAGQLAGGVTAAPALGAAISPLTEALGLSSGAAATGGTKSLLDIAKNEGKLKALGELGLRAGKSYTKALPAILAEGAVSSKEGGILTPEERSKLGEDVTGSALFGLPTVLGLTAATDVGGPLIQKASDKIGDIVQESPLLRQMKVAYGYGAEGINPRSPSTQLQSSGTMGPGEVPLAQKDNQRTLNLMNEIQAADKQVSQDVGNSLNKATQAGQTVDLSGDAKDAVDQMMSIGQKYPELADNAKANDIFSKIAQNGGVITPNDAKDLIDFTDAYINKFKTATNKTPLDESVLSNLIGARRDFSSTLKAAVPEYANAADRMTQFRSLVPETLLAGSTPADVTNTYYGTTPDKDEKLFNALKTLVQGTTRTGSGSQDTRTAFVNAMSGMKQFENQDAARLASGQIENTAFQRPVSSIEDQIKKYSDDAVARGSMDAIQPRAGLQKTAIQAITGSGAETGRSMSLSLANKMGLAQNMAQNSKNPVATLGKALYNAPDEAMRSLSGALKENPGLERYGQSLEDAINSGNENRKNQVLFTIMQNPSARALVGGDNENQGK